MTNFFRKRYLKPEKFPDFENTAAPAPMCLESKMERTETWADKVKWLTVIKDLVATIVGLIAIYKFITEVI